MAWIQHQQRQTGCSLLNANYCSWMTCDFNLVRVVIRCVSQPNFDSTDLDVVSKAAVVASFPESIAKPIQIVRGVVHPPSLVDGNQSTDNLFVTMTAMLSLRRHQSIFVYYIIYSQVVLIPVNKWLVSTKFHEIREKNTKKNQRHFTCTSNPWAQAASTNFWSFDMLGIALLDVACAFHAAQIAP